jgi:hypothetical protein
MKKSRARERISRIEGPSGQRAYNQTFGAPVSLPKGFLKHFTLRTWVPQVANIPAPAAAGRPSRADDSGAQAQAGSRALLALGER